MLRDLDQIAKHVSDTFEIPMLLVQHCRNTHAKADQSRARGAFCIAAHMKGYTDHDIAAYLGVTRERVNVMRSRATSLLETDAAFALKTNAVLRDLRSSHAV